MSRHRLVRNLDEDDYYDDDYDDYYDEEDYEGYDQTHAPPPKTKTVVPPPPLKSKSTTAAHAATAATAAATAAAASRNAAIIAMTGKSATTATVGVIAPPPGWGKPATTAVTLPTAPGGISKPPPGWGAPSHTKETTAPSSSAPAPSVSKTAKRGKGATTTTTTGSPSTQPLKSQQQTHYVPKPLPVFLQNTKSRLSMVVLGHVDAGKSTLMGQVLVKTGQITKREATKMGNLAHFLDENESERQRGVTMEIGTKTLRTSKHDFVLLDAPGHADFVPVMITGAAAADVAVLVVAAVTGEFEAGWYGGGQTKEHVMLARGLGVSQVIVAINKLDVEGWGQDRYNDIKAQVQDFLLQQDFKPKRIRFVPLSGLTGENVVERTDADLQRWYNGPTLLEAIDDFQPANRQLEKPLRFIVSDVYPEGKGVVARGRVVQGWVQVGDKLVVLPVGDVVSVQRVEHLQTPSDADAHERLSMAIAGETVQLVFAEREIDISRLSTGNTLSFPNARPPLTKKCKVKIMVMDQLAIPIIRGAQVLFHMHSLDIPCVMTNLIATLNRDGSIKKERPRSLPSGSNALVELTLSDRIVMEKYSECRALGRFVLRRGGDTVAIGLIDETL